jgi:Acyl-protein synthetase, LuxE
MLSERIAAFVRGEGSELFDDLARAAFALHFAASPPLNRLAAAAGLAPDTLRDWRDIPLIPTLAFKHTRLAIAEPREIFESSGTTATTPSRHYHPYPDLYRQVIDATFPGAFLEGDRRPPMLSLVPDRAAAPLSSLAFMLDHVRQRWGGEGTVSAAGPGGVRAQPVRSFLAARQRDRRPPVILATSFALAELVEGLTRLKLSFRLPPGSRIFETGGYKGRRRELSRQAIEEAIGQRLGLPPSAITREYGMTELTSHFYSAPGSDLYAPAPWVRFRILEPATLQPAEPGRPGLLAVFDLANVGSALHVLTEDLAIADNGRFRLVGRAAGAELRGCSLLSEALAIP